MSNEISFQYPANKVMFCEEESAADDPQRGSERRNQNFEKEVPRPWRQLGPRHSDRPWYSGLRYLPISAWRM